MSAAQIPPLAVMQRLRGGGGPGEWAFLDLREAGEAAEGHPFGSVNLPYSQLEARLPALLPRRGVEVVLLDAGDGVAARAAARMAGAGWGDVAIVAGGAPGWVSAGLPLFKGEHSFSKAFGEWVEHAFEVPQIGPEALAARMQEGSSVALIDGRPWTEHCAFTLPGAVNCPNAELGLRLPGMVQAGQSVVVHCAGRTRSIIGAQSVRDFGLATQVMALRDGTQGWELSGRAREMGAARAAPLLDAAVDAAARAAGRARAQAVMARYGIPEVAASTLGRWLRDDGLTTYLFDPRPEDEGETPPGFQRAPGTVLVQQTDRFIAVRGARVVLWDPDLVRAAFAALWLCRMGIDAHVLREAPPEIAPAARRIAVAEPPVIAAPALAQARAGGAVLLDLRSASAFRAGHVAGAIRALRPRLDRIGLARGARVALIAGDAALAGAAATDLHGMGVSVLGVNRDGPEAWRMAGLPLATEAQDDPARDIDVVRFCAGRHRGNLDDARAYLAWETGLLDRLSEAGLNPWPADPTFHSKTAGARAWP
ncbi:rhodanese-like domain-containing protein [Paragemmobacter ruber]|uniref:Sulfurtransferase n=1 Tax=Paragemmobacter ruber TaxID=1985673 RepID=A0ABW9Y3V0_9RHOB|nr:rhodanese-like domain-containing protein [Rhodobacter ruber]NBE07176.1 sulfurtransferase [Rhodobacter ruber]